MSSNLIVILVILVLIAVAGWWVYTYHPEWIPDFMLDFINGLFIRDGRIQITFQTNLHEMPDDFVILDGMWVKNNSGDVDDNMFIIACDQEISECQLYITYDDGKVDDIYIGGSGTSSVEILNNGQGQSFQIEVGVQNDGVQVYTKLVNCMPMGVRAFTPAQLKTLPKKISVHWFPVKDKKYNMSVRGRPIAGGETHTFYEKKDVSKGIVRNYFLQQFNIK
jgi:hypothetical protein